jgi:hypothetical protein
MSTKSILKNLQLTFLEQYLNNASQRVWSWRTKDMDELFKPYVDTFITDTYGTAVGVINQMLL